MANPHCFNYSAFKASFSPEVRKDLMYMARTAEGSFEI